jgi:hypothetical protein
MDDALRERVEALERAVTDGEHDLSAVADEAEALERLDDLESQVTALEEQVEELQAATQALRGYVGNVRSVNTDIEQRADAALAKAESLEQRLGSAGSQQTDDGQPSSDRSVDNSRNSQTGESRNGAAGVPQNEVTSNSQSGALENSPESTTRAAVDKPTTSRDTATTREQPRSSGEAHGASLDGSERAGGEPAHSHPTDGGQQAAVSGHCESCGRPREPGESTADGGQCGGPQATQGQTQQLTPGTRGSGTSPSADASTTADTSPSADGASTEPVGGVEGVPTVESLAQGSHDEDDSGPETLPSGDADPLVGATEGEDAGTLQRIRDLL